MQILKALLSKGLNIQIIKQGVINAIRRKSRKTAFDCLCMFILLGGTFNKNGV